MSKDSSDLNSPSTQQIVRSGLGVRPELFDAIFAQQPKLGFFEAHSENYFGDSIARAKLRELRQEYDISLHGVGLSLGRCDSLDQQHLKDLKLLVDEIEPLIVSEHLAWSAYSHRHLPDLLPLPLTDHSLAIMCEHVDQMQDALQRQILVENPSNYLLFDQLQMSEPEFLNMLASRTGCGLLLDINNVYVSAVNIKRDAREYLGQLDSQFIGQYHLAGYTEVERFGEAVLIDTHNHPVYPEVWELFEQAVVRHGSQPTLFEWDSDFPDFPVLLDECQKAEKILNQSNDRAAQVIISANEEESGGWKKESESVQPKLSKDQPETVGDQPMQLQNDPLAQTQRQFLDQLIELKDRVPMAIDEHKSRIWIYQNNVFAAVGEHLREVYPAVLGLVGKDYFKQMTQVFIQRSAPRMGNLNRYGEEFRKVIKEFSALQEMPYLPDLMTYEWALHKLYFVGAPASINPADHDQSELLILPVALSPCAVIISSQFPIYEIHRQSLPDYAGKVAIDLGQSQDCLLIYKNNYSVDCRVLAADEAMFLDVLEKSDNILQAMSSLQGSIGFEPLSAILAKIFELGLLTQPGSEKENSSL